MSAVEWRPSEPEASNMWQFMRFVEPRHQQHFTNYQQLYAWSIKEPSCFWQSLCDFYSINFDTPPVEIVNHYQHMLDVQWFRGATFNFAEKLLTREDDHLAIISIAEDGKRQVLSYKELRQQVAACAEGLKHAGVTAGERVAAIMPNVAFTVIAMLASASIGAIWSSCSPDFGPQAAFDRLGQIEPKILFTCDAQQYQGKTHNEIEKIQQLSSMMPSLKKIVVCPCINDKLDLSSLSNAVTWNEFLKPSTKLAFTSLPFAHPLYILYSSGTTGKPKCIVHGAGGTFLQHIKELGLHSDLKPDDNLCFYTTCGWMMWNWMVSALALGTTLTLYEGSPTFPDAGRLFHLIDQEKITVFGTSARFISAVEKAGINPSKIASLKTLRCILSTGSPLLPKNYDFVYQQIKSDVQLSSISGGTDILSCFALGNPLLPVRRGELQCLGLGMSVDVFDEGGASIQQKRGELVCTKAFPSMPVEFWQDPDKKRYKKTYFEHFPGVWTHGDFAEITEHHGLIIYGRSDTLLKPGGVRIGTAEIYRQVEKIPEVVDSVVVGQNWDDDVRVILFVKLHEGKKLTEQLEKTIRQTIRTNATPRHVPAKILQVADIPHTLSGKVVEVTVRQIVNGEPIANLESIANPESLNYFKDRNELRLS
jgi:acetoacetyl-CoA synthetase